jgi:hypothetical protein
MGLMRKVLTKKAGLPIERWPGFFIEGKGIELKKSFTEFPS